MISASAAAGRTLALAASRDRWGQQDYEAKPFLLSSQQVCIGKAGVTVDRRRGPPAVGPITGASCC
jgi:hypothetical protein